MAFQYAAKFICGVSKETTGLAHGIYETMVNIHNPGKEVQEIQYKLAVADEAKDGKIYPFKSGKIAADGAQFFACRAVRKIYDLVGTTVIEGFFVIQSKQPLDVIAVYTTNDLDGKGVPVIEVERVFERTI